jgi:hypothetical protein
MLILGIIAFLYLWCLARYGLGLFGLIQEGIRLKREEDDYLSQWL